MSIAETINGATLDRFETAVEQQNALREQGQAALVDMIARQRRLGMAMTRFVVHRLGAEREHAMELAALSHAGRFDAVMRQWSAFVVQASEDYAAASRHLAAIALGQDTGAAAEGADTGAARD